MTAKQLITELQKIKNLDIPIKFYYDTGNDHLEINSLLVHRGRKYQEEDEHILIGGEGQTKLEEYIDDDYKLFDDA